MKIGLLRHFKVTLGYPSKLVTSQELLIWQQEYNESKIEEVDIDHQGQKWSKCYSSDLERAKITASRAFEGNIIFLEDLREMSLYPVIHTEMRLPLWLHVTLIRLAWFLGHKSQKESKKEVVSRINRVLDEAINHGEDLLIVGHGGIMMFMRKELLKRGFSGPKFNRPENAKVYIFEKT
ncbi:MULTISPECIES: histidine phosphatase family protein [Bacillaceae]|jgi:broad specificity phosphatase PhoE|uniref:Fructose-2,6-bisphosphatase n=1 Tax=Mesobacillus selenatarsenatis (strain DSM 18680 / JCM 14380 / FERM P-15431 / SF-1) TaxID=1321606 RepID=A0A0A8X2Q1_MESS1|nr:MULTISPECIES: histidine phosphatase family protein [Bacillaceae]MBT2683472.1 histidine phosphatase family protein [Bacillus sp. ISL-37]GAM13534.1 fructose-2,6-bisphosphatase [Mesobacillus selenatarsenatis SF-1]